MAQALPQASATSTKKFQLRCFRACLLCYFRDEAGDVLAPPSGASFQELTGCEQLRHEIPGVLEPVKAKLLLLVPAQRCRTERLKERSSCTFAFSSLILSSEISGTSNSKLLSAGMEERKKSDWQWIRIPVFHRKHLSLWIC